MTLDLKQRHEITLIELDMYNSIPNIDRKTNSISYEYPNMNEISSTYESTRSINTIPTGPYDISTINNYIQEQLKENGNDFFSITVNLITFKCVININVSNFLIDLSINKFIGPLFGFVNVIFTKQGSHENSSIVNVLPVNSILVPCSLIKKSYLNEHRKGIFYSFFPNVSPAHKVLKTHYHDYSCL